MPATSKSTSFTMGPQATQLIIAMLVCCTTIQSAPTPNGASVPVASSSSSSSSLSSSKSSSSPASSSGSSSSMASSDHHQQQQPATISKQQSVATPVISASSAFAAAQPTSSMSNSHDDQYSGFDSTNPFSDDSLWQIPIHLAKDLSASNDDQAQSSADAPTADRQNVDDDSDDYSASSASDHTRSITLLQSSPTQVISASSGHAPDLKTAAGYHYPSSYSGHGHHSGAGHHGYGSGSHGHDHYHGKYYQFASVPYPGAWEYGYRRGNPYHTIERHEHAKGPHFQTKVKWSDKHGGYGVHVWDYNHDDHHGHYGHDDHHEPAGYGHHGHHGAGHGPSHGYGHH